MAGVMHWDCMCTLACMLCFYWYMLVRGMVQILLHARQLVGAPCAMLTGVSQEHPCVATSAAPALLTLLPTPLPPHLCTALKSLLAAPQLVSRIARLAGVTAMQSAARLGYVHNSCT
jgi:hypothetical protein